jgi:hypothetical protein
MGQTQESTEPKFVKTSFIKITNYEKQNFVYISNGIERSGYGSTGKFMKFSAVDPELDQ